MKQYRRPEKDTVNPPGQIVNPIPATVYKPTHGGYPDCQHSLDAQYKSWEQISAGAADSRASEAKCTCGWTGLDMDTHARWCAVGGAASVPPLPAAAHRLHDEHRNIIDLFTAEQMRAYRAARTENP